MSKLILVIISLIAGLYVGGIIPRSSRNVEITVNQPDDCFRFFGKQPNGWTFHAEYKGGLNKGGAVSHTTYGCE